ncbi:uncharacterized protein LOC124933669 [Impatiens glandulifera]|uniref:uncharacterized protein LOC124933669 n=1 Tax=Impatiens glandulifera TaxID=253017 RepID=UPI001FB0670B|nr:uncharacterized protein LOC124933669 [Impatiens glandulifera]
MERRRKQSQGKKKIEMKLIEDENARMMAILLTSMTGKMHSFGSPSVDVILDPYMNRNYPIVPNCVDEYREARMNYLNQQINEVDEKLDEEKSRRTTLLGQEGDGDFKSVLEVLDQDGVKKLKKFMLELKEEVALRKRELTIASDASSSTIASEASSSKSGKEASSSKSGKEVTIQYCNGSPIPEGWLKL